MKNGDGGDGELAESNNYHHPLALVVPSTP